MKNQTKFTINLLVAWIATMLSTAVVAQTGTVHFTPDFSMRNGSLGHKYEMVSWDPSQYREFTYWVENSTGGASEFMNWRAIFPAGYDPNGTTKYPMIVMLHGAGESGREWTDRFAYAPSDPRYDNNGHNLLWGGKEHRDAVNTSTFPGIVIFPQVNANGAWSNAWDNGTLNPNGRMATLIVEHMINAWDVDPDRIAVHGLSNGGKGTWDLATKRPDLFAAMLPMSGVGTDVNAMTDIAITTAIWQFQGGTDTNPSQGFTNTWMAALESKGGDPRYTVYPSLGHGVWNTAYAEPDFFSWILQQNKKNIFVYGGSTTLCSGGTIKLGISAGYLAYQWRRNGVDIAGATARDYVANQAGSYTVRFQRRVDSQWVISNPVVLDAPGTGSAPVLTNTGSTYLPIQSFGSIDNVLNLVAPAGYSQYKWFKNGALWSTTTTNIKLVANNTGSNATFAGSYTVQVQLPAGCYSASSNAVTVQYNSPPPTTPVFNILSRTAVSPTQINITWENPAGETAFEVWRYRKGDYVAGPPATGYPLQKFQLVATVGADVTSYSDTGLRPGASYIYRIRAVVPGGTTVSNQPNPTFILPPADVVAPAAPADFVATDVAPTTITLGWAHSTDNDNNIITAYEVYNNTTLLATLKSDTVDTDRTDGNPAAPNSYIVNGLTPGGSYTFKVRARDYKGNFSGYSTLVVSSEENANGVEYKYWQFTGTLNNLASFNFAQTPLEEGVVTNFDLSVRNQEDFFVFEYNAFLQIDNPGTYRFYTNSDDGSMLYIDGTAVVNNDGLHAPRTISGTYTFASAGKFPIKVTFYEQGGGQVLVVKYNQGITNNYTAALVIPNDKLFLFGDPSGMAMMMAAPPVEEEADSDNGRKQDVTAWPMPFENRLNLQFKKESGIQQVIVLDKVGNPVMSIPVSPTDTDIEMELGDLPSGQYILVVGSKRIRVIKR